MADDEAVSELTGPVAGVILTLLCNLRHCFLTDQSEIAQLQDISHYITLLDAGGNEKDLCKKSRKMNSVLIKSNEFLCYFKRKWSI